MPYFPPHPLPEIPAIHAPAEAGFGRRAIPRDILWNKPVFKAPALRNPRVALDPLPFTATRVTQRSR